MYRCRDCGRFFEEPIEVHDDPSPSGVSLSSGYYTELYCPRCGSEKIEEAGTCASCKEPTEASRILCDDCRQELAEIIGEVAEKMHITYEMMEDAVYELYEV